MIEMSHELKQKLLDAKSAEEAVALVKEAGQDITLEEAAQLWEEIKRVREPGVYEFSKDELEAVGGGYPPFEMPEHCTAFFGAYNFADGSKAYDDPRDRDHSNKKDDPKDW